MISAVLFDLDGLLSDTEILHCRAYQNVLLRHGITLTEEQYQEAWIRRGHGISEFLQSNGLSLDPITLRKAKVVEYATLVDTSCVPMPGALDALARLHGHKSLALASSAYSDAVGAVLAKLNITHYFSAIVSGDQVPRLKPHPDIFLHAASLLNVYPSNCVVVEDAEKGIRAAHAAGMRCIAVPTRHTIDNDFSTADAILPSLYHLTLELLDRL